MTRATKYVGPGPERPTDEFWRMVDLARTQPEQLERETAELTQDELVELHWTFTYATEVLLEPEYIDHASPELSEDGLYDLVAWVVAQGKDHYQRVLNDATAMPQECGDWDGADLQSTLVKEYDRRYHTALPLPDDLPDGPPWSSAV